MQTTLSEWYSEVARSADTDPVQKIGVDVTSRVLSEAAKSLCGKPACEVMQILDRWLHVAHAKE